MAQSKNECPSFNCSGKLLWGQLHCILEGLLSKDEDSGCVIPEAEPTGTILQRNFKYKVKAFPGRWEVKELVVQTEWKEEPFLAGFIIYCNEVAKPADVLKTCSELGMTSDVSKNVIYVNRYDWSWAHDLGDAPEELLFDANEEDGWSVINQFKENLAAQKDNSLIKEALLVDNKPVGVHLACPHTEYELGWLVFHPIKRDELIAIVYDGAYTGLEGNISLVD
ncbi:hypothetical protein Bhyg_08197, partial [Pseudolycoriella hygida]